MINRCNIAAETDEEYFRVGIFIPFLDNFIASFESRFTAHKFIIGGLQCLIPADPNVGPNAQQIESIQVLGKFYQNDLTKSPEELVSELKLWYRKLSRLNVAKKATDALNSIKECCPDAFPNIFTLITILFNSSGDNVHQRTIVFNITQAENLFAKHYWYHPHEWPRFAKHL